MAKNNKKYNETSRQKNQVEMLLLGRYDFVQMDLSIFNYYLEQLKKEAKIDTSQPVDKFALFGKSPNGILFKSKELRDLCLKNLKKSQEDPALKKYLYLNH